LSEPDYVASNRDRWTATNSEHTDAQADRSWRAEEITWGMFTVDWARKWPAEEIWAARKPS
jgi:hypothetical protein